MKKIVLVILFIFTVSPIFASRGRNVTEKVGSGTVDWTDGILRTTGSAAPSLGHRNVQVGRLDARKRAMINARRKMSELIRSLRISGKKRVSDIFHSSAELDEKVSAVLEKMNLRNTKYYSDGSVDLSVEISISEVAEVVDQERENLPVKREVSNQEDTVVFDARGRSIKPALFPSILSEAGSSIFDQSLSSGNNNVTFSRACYVRGVGQVKRVLEGNSFRLVKVKSTGDGSALVVSDEEAEKVRKDIKESSLRTGGIVILF